MIIDGIISVIVAGIGKEKTAAGTVTEEETAAVTMAGTAAEKETVAAAVTAIGTAAETVAASVNVSANVNANASVTEIAAAHSAEIFKELQYN